MRTGTLQNLRKVFFLGGRGEGGGGVHGGKSCVKCLEFVCVFGALFGHGMSFVGLPLAQRLATVCLSGFGLPTPQKYVK